MITIQGYVQIYTLLKIEHRIYDPIWDYKQLTQDRKGQKKNITEEEILELIACEDFQIHMTFH